MRETSERNRGNKGQSLIDLMIAMLVLAVGLVGSASLVALSIMSNARSGSDTTSAALAQMVVGQISAIPAGGSVTSVTVQDCAGNSWTIDTSGATSGSGANLTTSGLVDYTQTYSSVPAGYAMKYTVCDASNGLQAVYDLRWNITLLPSGKEELVVVAAQLVASGTSSLPFQSPPVDLRTVVGNQGN
jgi:Tfp pilus assembly protein PilV